MPIYRTLNNGGAPNEIQRSAAQWRPEVSEARLRADALREDAERKRRSKAAPCNVPLPRTLAWAAELPREARPRELIRSFPRIANMLAADWGEPDVTNVYLDQLLIDRRVNRKGFPPDVRIELLALRKYYASLHGQVTAASEGRQFE